MRKILSLLVTASTTFGCTFPGPSSGGEIADAAFVTNEHGLDRRNLDESTSPCSDFYQFANGSWLMRNPVPAEYGSWGIGDELRERNDRLLREILEEAAAAGAPGGTHRQQVGDFWRSGMDTAKIEAEGLSPLAAELARIDEIENPEDVVALVGDLHREDVFVLFGLAIFPDLKDNQRYIAYAVQGGLGLPDRDYYTRQDAEAAQLLDAYRGHVSGMLQLLGDPADKAETAAARILALETRLAEASLTKVEQRNPATYYNVISVATADEKTPLFPWSAYFQRLGLPDIDSFSFAHPRFFAEVNAALAEVPPESWQSYLRWHLIRSFSPYLSDAFVSADFEFFGRSLAGKEKQLPRWKRVVDQTSTSLGEALGKVYVERAFPPQTKVRAGAMIENLRAAVRMRIEGLDWMGSETKARALAKLDAFATKIGYPDEWRDYSKLVIGSESYLANVRAANLFEMRRNLDKIGKAIDRGEWNMSPQTVNAGYNPVMNEIVFPAAIMQPPFFDGEVDDAVNYGAMGSIIGHEFMHGFDDQGSRFDADGNLRNWWTESDRGRFEERTSRLVEQYNGFVPIDGLTVNGELTLGENIGDLAGVTMAYYALKQALRDTSPEALDGFSPEQRFFLSWAQSWRKNYRDEAIRLQVHTDPHSFAKFRVNGPLANMPEFAAAWGCEDQDAMVLGPDRRAQLW